MHYAQVDDHWGFANGIEAQRQYNLWFTADDELTDVSETLLAKFFLGNKHIRSCLKCLVWWIWCRETLWIVREVACQKGS